ncbi:MAG: ATP-binding protein [Bacteroidales bacterium]|nr:ATP-binding protein [Bacteroidales bacterium]
MIHRGLFDIIEKNIDKGKVIIIIGPRQVGKTTLVKQFISKHRNRKTLYLNCDEIEVKNALTTHSLAKLRELLGSYSFVVIDEAQRVKDIGLTLKLISDNMPGLQLLVTGSSALELSNRINEPLTGRKFEFNLFPFSSCELVKHSSPFEEKKKLHGRLVYGMYPDVINNPGDERLILNNLASSYLYRDALTYQEIRKPELLDRLLKALAMQISAQVSYNELAQLLSSDPDTISRYIQLLEKAYVIFRLNSYSKNLRNELKRSRKIYFYDNGIRNALIGNFNDPDTRQDTGALWENFLVSERIKKTHYENIFAQSYFWRTAQQQEIDYIEVENDLLNIYEFKWNPHKKYRFPKTFINNYEINSSSFITTENYLKFIC